MLASAIGAVLYVLWWAGAIPWLRQEDAVRLAALLVMLFLFTVVGFLGYVAAVTKPPQRPSFLFRSLGIYLRIYRPSYTRHRRLLL